jgi:AcrR family transcriptional regulator
LFSEKGFSATSVDEIASAADVSRSTFFRYFGSKEAVLFDEMDDTGAVFLRLLLERPIEEDSITAFEASLKEVPTGENEDERRVISRLLDQLLRHDPALKVRRAAETERWTGLIAGTFARRQGRSEPAPEDDLAAAICMATAEQIGREWRESDDQIAAVDAIRKGFELLRTTAGGA